ncbi:tetratricopeptide repeat protein [Okeanomitos corallinicola TIOX110]|uniref:Tetratricopeptide repeat protein n=1 Tax=Okeanomitos corallinicola TIOX110 TaxID=3133117 RepID=A0ABZ2UWC4_9CYAN
MQYKYTIPTLFILTSVTLTQPATAQGLSCDKKIDEIGEKITVLIDNGKNSGSGTLIKQEGNLYTVLTSFHNFKNTDLKYSIVTHDGQRYPLNVQSVKPLKSDIDLAEVKFRSNNNYQVAKLGNSDGVKRRDNVYVGGFRPKTANITVPLYDCLDGQVSANAKQVTVDGGYNLIYTNPTLKGMSGGPVLNQQGELIGIHGRGEDEYDNNKLDRYAGVPINFYLQLAAGNTKTPIIRPTPSKFTADDYFALAGEKYGKGDYQGAILAYNRVLNLNPNNTEALLYRGATYSKLKDYQKEIADYNQAIKINPNYAKAYYNRGIAHRNLKDYQKAIADYNQAIKLNPNYADAYNNRGVARYDLKDYQKAIADYNQAIKINPNYAEAYNNRGVAHRNLKDYQKAIADYNQAIKINPNYAEAYNNRGFARYNLKDYQKAIADYNQAIKINPNFDLAYNNRGIARYDLKDYQKAIADYNQAIKINPNYADAYYNRGLSYRNLGKHETAISDFRQAAKLYQQQGKSSDYQDALNRIRELQQR